jgi:hypothetical protein
MVKKLTPKKIKELEKQLVSKPALVWDRLNESEKRAVETVARDYKTFIDKAKTEREAAAEIIRRAKTAGFRPLDGKGAGARRYSLMMGKVAALFVAGKPR